MCQTEGGIRHHIPQSVQGRGGWGREELGGVEGVPAHCRMGWAKQHLKIPSNPNYYNSIILCAVSEIPEGTYPQYWPDTRMVQEITEGFCFAPADVKFPDFLLSWGFENALLQGEGHQAPVWWGPSMV